MLVIYERFLGANSGIMTPAPVLFSAAKPIFKIFCAVQKFTLKIKKKNWHPLFHILFHLWWGRRGKITWEWVRLDGLSLTSIPLCQTLKNTFKSSFSISMPEKHTILFWLVLIVIFLFSQGEGATFILMEKIKCSKGCKFNIKHYT